MGFLLALYACPPMARDGGVSAAPALDPRELASRYTSLKTNSDTITAYYKEPVESKYMAANPAYRDGLARGVDVLVREAVAGNSHTRLQALDLLAHDREDVVR